MEEKKSIRGEIVKILLPANGKFGFEEGEITYSKFILKTETSNKKVFCCGQSFPIKQGEFVKLEGQIFEKDGNSLMKFETITRDYELEYGTASIEMHKDSIKPGQKVVVIDDLIATGGTIEATCALIEELGGEVVKLAFLMELAGLNGRERLKKYDVASVICYPGK